MAQPPLSEAGSACRGAEGGCGRKSTALWCRWLSSPLASRARLAPSPLAALASSSALAHCHSCTLALTRARLRRDEAATSAEGGGMDGWMEGGRAGCVAV